MKNHRNRFRLVVGLLAVITVLTVVIQIFRGQGKSVSHVTTVSAVEYETVETMIYAVRKEYIIEGIENAFLVPLIANGDRVARGETIAAAFPSDEAARSYTEYLEKTEEIEYYNRLSSYSLSQYTDFTSLTDNTYAAVYALSARTHTGDCQDMESLLSDFRSALTAKQTASGASSDFTAKISQLRVEADDALRNAGSFTSIAAAESGYFYADSDGFENVLTYDDISSIGVNDIDGAFSALPEHRTAGVMGRIVNSFDWYFVCALDQSVANTFAIGDKYEVELPYNAVDPFKAEVYRINDATGDRAAVVFRVRDVSTQLASLRSSFAAIRLHAYSGYKIPSEAIRIVNGQRGVFILRNNIANFRTFDVLYSTDAYTIVDRCRDENGEYVDSVKIDDPSGEKDENGNPKKITISCLKLYDEVITEGVDLYDGKLVN